MNDRVETKFEFPAHAAERVLAATQLRQTAWNIVEAFIRRDHPEWSSDEVTSATRERFVDSTR